MTNYAEPPTTISSGERSDEAAPTHASRVVDQAVLTELTVGRVTGDFLVPDYQRGYRWGDGEVRRLLDDIWEAAVTGQPAYYLQPIVVRRQGTAWELIDGQQRLTTLFLLLQYLERECRQGDGAHYSIAYSTRPGSAEYLRTLDDGHRRDNPDFFHMHGAGGTIARWFGEAGADRFYRAGKMFLALYEIVRVIWYEAPSEADPIAIFTRLNAGRIPLTAAELVKAELLAAVGRSAVGADRTAETAAQWDMVERDLREPELWAFATGSADESPTHIDLLLDHLARKHEEKDPPPFFTYYALREAIRDHPLAFFAEILDLHSLLLGWYDDRSLFHRIGYLVAAGVSVSRLIDDASGSAKSTFDELLVERIRRRLNVSEPQLADLTYSSTAATRALLLMNVEAIREREHSAERYSFREQACHTWSLEHIHAQHAEPLHTEEEWRAWLGLHRDVLNGIPGLDERVRQALCADVDQALAAETVSRDVFRSLEERVTRILTADPDADMHAIDNLALLSARDNSALSNSVFAVKRAKVLQRDYKGNYIPVCTRNIFLKYYSSGSDAQPYFWGPGDRAGYLVEMKRLLGPYLLPEVTV